MLRGGLAVGLDISGAGGLEHSPVGLGGADHVLGLGGAQERSGQGVDSPEGLSQVQEEVVLQGLE